MSNASIVVRDALPSDVATVREFNRRLALETEGLNLDGEVLHQGVLAVLQDPVKGRYFLAEEGGRVVGQTMITFEWSDWRGGWIWWIQSVYVAMEARRRGVFRGIHSHILNQAKASADVRGVRLYVDQHNHAAQDVYSALGLTRTGYLFFERLFQPPSNPGRFDAEGF